MARMRIFTPAEHTAFETPPVFTPSERQHFFAIPQSVQDLLATIRTPAHQVGFLLMLGYFRATKRFFGRQFHAPDVEYVARLLGWDAVQAAQDAVHNAVHSRHRRMILAYVGVRRFDEQARHDLAPDLQTMVRAQMRPKQMLRRIVALLAQRKMEIPSAFALTAWITTTIAAHHQALITRLTATLSAADRQQLDTLLEKVESEAEPDLPRRRFRLTQLKKISQATRPAKIQAAVEDLQTLRQLYQPLAPLLQALDLSPAGVLYYAHTVLQSGVFHLARRGDEERYLHLICFIAHQFFRMQDALVDVLLTAVQTILHTCQREHKEQYYAERSGHQRTLRTFVAGVTQGAVQPLAEIETLAFSPTLADDEKVRRIQDVLTRGTLQRTLVHEQLAYFTGHAQTAEDTGYYAVLEAKSLRLQHRVAAIVKHLDFLGDDTALLAAIQHYQQHDGVVGATAPLTFLTEAEQQVVSAGKLRVSLYKAWLFIKIAEAMKASTLHLTHSYKYRALDDYLIPKAAWQANRTDYLARAGLTAAADWDRMLQHWAAALDQQYHATNRRILAGDNPHIRFEKDGSWHLTTPKVEKPSHLPLLGIFPEKRYISLLEVLATINRFTHFLEAFEHWQGKYTRVKPPDRAFLAGIIGLGCFIGLPQLASISTPLSEAELDTTVHWYFSPETIHAANDRILHFMDQLELPDLYRRHPDRLHTSSDGQRFEVAVESLLATYSFKYFGQRQGVSTYNFLDERHFGWHSDVISAAEREAHYVIDGLMHNDVVQSDLHSTDTDGYTEVLFGVLHLLGFTFAPRIKDVPGQRLYALKSRKAYALHGYKLLPHATLQTQPVATQWDEILRFVATIKLKEATASQLFKRLNSSARQHPLYHALKEFGKLPKSDFLLRWIDDVTLRQAVEKQLNKIENANKFSRAVAFGNNQAFLYGDKVEQEMAEGCRRLIKNAIVCWNYLFLSQQIAEADSVERRQELLTAVQQGSVVSWRHVNVQGEYDFSDEKLQDSVGLRLPVPLGLRRPPHEEDAVLPSASS